jgi:hypothetical protein
MDRQFATPAQLRAWVGAAYSVSEDDNEVDRMLLRASQVVSRHVLGHREARSAIDGTADLPEAYSLPLRDATLAQAEFWLEVGEEHDVVGLTGHVQTGRLTISKLPHRLAPRASDVLREAGLRLSAVDYAYEVPRITW